MKQPCQLKLPAFTALLLLTLACASFADPPVPEESKPAEPRFRRVLLLVSGESEECRQELIRLESGSGPFPAMRRRGWKIGRAVTDQIQIVDVDAVHEVDLAKVIGEIDITRLPAIVCVEKDQIVRSFRDGCTTPLDAWTFGWMMTGNDERPVAYVPEAIKVATTNSYPLRGNHWSVDGDWNPGRETLLRHLRGPEHAYQLNASWNLEAWSVEELRSVHDDIHEREDGYRGRSSGYGSGRGTSGRAEPSSGSVRKPGRAVR